ERFYAEGLRFECTRCSRCCRHAPGYVFLSQEDLRLLAETSGMSPRGFFEEYCREVDLYGIPRVSLRERDNYDCILWNDGGCSLYEARPLQCRSYPFWSSNLACFESWTAVCEECPGAGQGQLHSPEEIEAWLRMAEGRQLLRGSREIP
ncbi:MAG: YkgJ family cysteine cluster protein, partial [Spirochaetales bacterium]|nr:YkgJ family cysteine cluster protein [Spirochaetales bacterium]